MQWTNEQFTDASVITTEAGRVGLNLGWFTLWAGPQGMQIGDGPFKNTEMTLTGNSYALGLLLGSMCQGSGDNCFTADNTTFDSLFHKNIEFNFRQNVATDSIQITGRWDANTYSWIVQLDIDPNNPLKNPLAHTADVVQHWTTGHDTDYSQVAKRLGIDPLRDNPWCH